MIPNSKPYRTVFETQEYHLDGMVFHFFEEYGSGARKPWASIPNRMDGQGRDAWLLPLNRLQAKYFFETVQSLKENVEGGPDGYSWVFATRESAFKISTHLQQQLFETNPPLFKYSFTEVIPKDSLGCIFEVYATDKGHGVIKLSNIIFNEHIDKHQFLQSKPGYLDFVKLLCTKIEEKRGAFFKQASYYCWAFSSRDDAIRAIESIRDEFLL